MSDLLSTTVNWLSIHWGAILSLVGGAAGLSTLLETVLNKFHVNSKKLAYSAIHVLGIVSAVVAYLLANLPTGDVPAIYASLVILAQTIHRFMISPVYNKYIVPFLQYEATLKPTVVQPTTPTVPNLPETESDFGA